MLLLPLVSLLTGAMGEGLSCRAYMGATQAHVRQLCVTTNRWVVDASLEGGPAAIADVMGAARQQINTGIRHVPQLWKLCQRGARPGWACRDHRGDPVRPTKPTWQQFAANPAEFLLQLLGRTAELFVNTKWLTPPPQPACLRFCAKYSVRAPDAAFQPTNPALPTNMCLPVHIPPRLARRRRIALWRRHYCHVTKQGYIRIYLGVDKDGKCVTEYLHRLVLLAFGDPLDRTARKRFKREKWDADEPLEARHGCCHCWCANKNHLGWGN